jgi:YegS/Rv2252/BmrU family lipid kinase
MTKNNHKNDLCADAKLIFNPTAGVNPDAVSRLEEIIDCLSHHNISVNIRMINHKAKAKKIAEDAVRDGYKLVIAMGGDGTIENAARGILGTKTTLGVLPDGTYNNFSRNLGIPQDLDGACALLTEGQSRKIDAGQIKTPDAKRFIFFEVATLGIGSNLMQDAEAIAKEGKIHIVDALKTILTYKSPVLDITLDGDTHIHTESLLVTVSNTRSFGQVYLAAPGASMVDGLLDICIYSKFNKPELITYFEEIANGRIHPDSRVERYQAKKVRILTDPEIEVMGDDTMVGKSPAKIRVLPGALRVIAPKQIKKPTEFLEPLEKTEHPEPDGSHSLNAESHPI